MMIAEQLTHDGAGTPVWVFRRTNGGAMVRQATSQIYLSTDEARELAHVLTQMDAPTTTSPAKARLLRYPIAKAAE
jgi:hypothetical protein